MSQRRKNQQKLDLKLKNLQKKLQSLQLPKLQKSKVEDINNFLKDPSAVEKGLNGERQQVVDSYQNVEPWMELTQDSQILRKEKVIRFQINSLLAEQIVSPLQKYKEPETLHFQQKRIQNKMKKFQPINSSFSSFYGQKKNTQDYNHKHSTDDSEVKKTINLPGILKRKSLSRSPHRTSTRPSPQGKIRSGKMLRHNSQYENTIKYIYELGESEHHKFETLNGKLNKMTLLMQGKYDKLNNDYANMVNEIGSYRLQQENDKNLKAKFFDSLLNKKRL